MKKDLEQDKKKIRFNDAERDADFKRPSPREFIPTELGSAVFASVEGQPPDEEFLVTDKPKKNG